MTPANDADDPAELAELAALEALRRECEAEAQIRQLWRWAAWACPDGIPPGWTAEERPPGA